MRAAPVPVASSLSIFNLRELMEGSLEECELGLTSSALTNLATGTLLPRTMFVPVLQSSSYPRVAASFNRQHIKNAIRKPHPLIPTNLPIHYHPSHCNPLSSYLLHPSTTNLIYSPSHHHNHSLGLAFQFGATLVSRSTYAPIASSFPILPSFFHDSHLYRSTIFSLLGCLVLFSPSVACLNNA